MTLHTREGSPKNTTAATPAVTTTNQRHSDTTDNGFKTDPQAQLLAALAANAKRMTGTTGSARRTQLLDRAQLWEELAQNATLTCTQAQVYRNVASVCRQEADTLNISIHSDLHGRWSEKAA